MNSKILVVSFSILVLLALFSVGRILLAILATSMALALLVWLIERHVWVRVPALTTAVTFNRETKGFMRLLPPGRHWLQFPLEHITDFISTTPGMVKGTCSKAQTNGGIVVNAEWSLAYVINPATLSAELRPTLAKTLAAGPEGLIRTHVNNCIQQYINQHTVAELYSMDARRRIERELRNDLVERLTSFGVQVYRIILHSIELPTQVQAGLEAAHKQELSATGEARAMERLQQAISKFSDADMTRLLQLKQLHELGQHGVAVQIPVFSLNGEGTLQQSEITEKENGRAPFTNSHSSQERPYAH